MRKKTVVCQAADVNSTIRYTATIRLRDIQNVGIHSWEQSFDKYMRPYMGNQDSKLLVLIKKKYIHTKKVNTQLDAAF